ncbi:MAG: filamentous hemagglutinin N-terminal domain-containing protein [Leptolyngbyaceae cyanobacterium bins.349]|nr:filamentous hemagglutinin N-terminal domain-containing protein [Leptolyngbyaceae cyanobacterium bins.349]
MVKRSLGTWVRSGLVSCLLGFSGGSLLLPSVTQAQIQADPTLGTVVTPFTPGACVGAGGICDITNGTERGSNLFHSFQQFSLPNGDRASFITNPTIRNVLVRVTGNTITNINGTIETLDINFNPVARNFFLLNPNGIIFGPNAGILVGGSFLASTAERMVFQDGTVFDTRDTTVNPLLTVSVPTGLQMGQTPREIRMQGSFLSAGVFDDFTSFTLLGRNVSLDDARVITPGQRVEIGAITGADNVGLNANGSLNVPDGLLRGDVSFRNGSLLDVRLITGNGGDIGIIGNNISVLSGSVLLAGILPGNGTATSQAGDITLHATGVITIQQGSGVGNLVGTGASGNTGNLNIISDSLAVQDNARLLVSTSGIGNVGNVVISARARVLFSNSSGAINRLEEGAEGKGGNIQISANQLEVYDESQLQTATRGVGDAGNIVINAHNFIVFNNQSAALSLVAEGAQGKGGNIEIFTHTLELRDGAQLVASTLGNGDAGNVTIETHNHVLLSDGGTIFSIVGDILNQQAVPQGNGGTIRISSKSLELRDGAQLAASTLGRGNAGNVIIDVRDYVIFNNGAIFSSVGDKNQQIMPQGNGGNIRISATNLEVLNGAQLIANTFGVGNAGNVIIDIRDRAIFDGVSGNLRSSAVTRVDNNAQGNGGNIQISANQLEILNGAQLIANTFGAGNAGNVILNIQDFILLNGDSAGVSSAVEETGRGNGGNIQIATNTLEVLNGSAIESNTLGIGNAGNVTIDARHRAIFRNLSAIFSNVELGAKGKGGNVQIATSTMEVSNGAQILTSTFDIGDAGNIAINAHDAVIISGTSATGFSSGLFTSTLTDGQGGNVAINTRAFQIAEGAKVNASTTGRGNSGNLEINAATVDILKGGQLLAITEDTGKAGNITVNATDRLTISDNDPAYDTRLAQFRSTTPVREASGIFVQSQGTGEAGDITVTAPQIRMDRGVISAESAAVDGGNINLNVGQLLLMRNGSLISATAGTAQQGGDGGNVTINAPRGFIIGVRSENSDITANAFTGSGGRVNITAQGIFGLQFRPSLTPFSDITASSTFGISGIVTLNTPNVDPSRGLTQLPANLIDTNRILANSCIVRDVAAGGTFIVTGTGGLPVRPGDAPLPVFATGDVQSVATDGRTDETDGEGNLPASSVANPLPEAIAEAQGIYKLPDGQVILSWECGK